jgi:hypothetical protein
MLNLFLAENGAILTSTSVPMVMEGEVRRDDGLGGTAATGTRVGPVEHKPLPKPTAANRSWQPEEHVLHASDPSVPSPPLTRSLTLVEICFPVQA